MASQTLTLPQKLGNRPKLGDEAARWLRDALMSGAYKPGQRLAIEGLAAQMGVSSMPIREALVALANEGLLEVLPQRGFRVAAISQQDVEDLFKVHSHIAGLLAERTATAIADDTIAQLNRVQARIKALANHGAVGTRRAAKIEELNFSFHRQINIATDSVRLRWFLRAATRFIPRRFYEAVPGWIETTVEDHPAIIAALELMDGETAKQLMERHVLKGGQLVISHLRERGFWSESDRVTRAAGSV